MSLTRKFLIACIALLLLVGLIAFFVIRGATRWSALESLITTATIAEVHKSGPRERLIDDGVIANAEFGAFRVALDQSIVNALKAGDGQRLFLVADTAQGDVGLMECAIVDRENYGDVAEVASSIVQPMPWCSGSAAVACCSDQARLWWAVDTYDPPSWLGTMFFTSERFEREFALRTAVGTFMQASDAPIEYVVTKSAVVRVRYTRLMDEERFALEIYSRRSELSVVILVKSSSIKWATDTTEAILASFEDRIEPSWTNKQIDASVRAAVESGLKPSG